MDRKDWTPEEIKLKEALGKVYENDTRMPSRPLDLSFMNEPPVKKQSFYKKHRRLINVAAIVAIIAVTSITTAIFVSNDYASAVQDKLQRKVFEMKHGVVVATDEEFAEEGETVWEITDFDTAVKAKELVPELPIPGYVPEGYEFEKLVLSVYNDNNYTANYEYCCKSTTLYISCQTYNNEYNVLTTNVLKTIEQTDRNIMLWQDPTSLLKCATIILNDSLIIITPSENTLNNEQLINLACEFH